MDDPIAIELVEQAIAAHGGVDRWEGAEEISVRISTGGLAFASKLQGSAIRRVEARVSTRGQHVTLAPYPRPGRRGVLEQDGSVRIETDSGEPLEAREHARSAFADLRHKLWWDRLDILYFATYAIWTYISTPFVFAREDYQVRELDPWQEGGERLRRLAVTFPRDVHTHSREQVFYFDANGLIRRHDYTAEPIGGWARAAHYCLEHRSFDGLMLPTRRRVYPRRHNNLRRPWPLLVWIDVSSTT
ncbi:MAG: hypothetical protein ACLQMH_03830 [Solirubrobacteraceae bacterium]